MRKAIALFLIAFMLCGFSFSDKYYGSVRSTRYHYYECRFVRKIDSWYLIAFKSASEAVKLGYVPCEECRPPVPEEE